MKPSRMPARRPITGKLLELLRHPMLTLTWGDPQHITLMVPGQELTLPATPTLRHLIRTDMSMENIDNLRDLIKDEDAA